MAESRRLSTYYGSLYMHRTYGSHHIIAYLINGLKPIVTKFVEATPLYTKLQIAFDLFYFNSNCACCDCIFLVVGNVQQYG